MTSQNEQLRQWFADNSEFFVLSAIAMRLQLPGSLFVGWVLGDPKSMDSDYMERVEEWAKAHGYGYHNEPLQAEFTLPEQSIEDAGYLENVKLRLGEMMGVELVKKGAIKFSEPKPQAESFRLGLHSLHNAPDPFRKHKIHAYLVLPTT
jgi:hypothetical protein